MAAVSERSAGRLQAAIEGDPARIISSLAPLSAAGPADLSFLVNPRYRSDARTARAGAIALSQAEHEALGAAANGNAFVVIDDAYAWFALAAQQLHPERLHTPGISPGAHVDPAAEVASSASIEAGASVGARARIGARAAVRSGAFIGAGASLGDDTRINPRAVILDGCSVGARTIIHSGAVIGADGFGFAPLDGRWIKIPQVGRVVIGDDVEIGANTTIDRGAMGDTTIEDGVKLDNQIQVGHNCVIGAHTVIAGCVGIAGSTRIGRGCQIGGAAMISGHLSIADGCVIGGGTLVDSSISERGHYSGSFPIMKHRDWQRAAALTRQLDQLRNRIRELESVARKDTP
ncbi:MAG: UDP-3-O-(3-hydroxymyristoyl)glucosamine N-acyltransferase [Burkholderiaceae bacterium]